MHMNEYNDIIKYKLNYPTLNKIYKSLSETHLKIAENAKADADKFKDDNSHLTLNLKENLNFIESKNRNSSNIKKQYLDESPSKKSIPKSYESGNGGGGSGTTRLRQERPPRSQPRNSNVDPSNYASGASAATATAASTTAASTTTNTFYNNSATYAAGGGSHVTKGGGRGASSLEEIEASYVYKPREDLFSSNRKNSTQIHTEPVEKVHYPKVYDHVKNSQVNSSNNWRE